MAAAWAKRKANNSISDNGDEDYESGTKKQKLDGRASSNPCPHCGMDFPFQGILAQHLAEIHDDPEAMELQCAHCRKWLGSKQLLQNHMRSMHTKERPYRCDFCPKQFASQKCMGAHRQKYHYEEWEENKERIMARNRALTHARRYKSAKEDTLAGEDNGEAAILDEATGMVYN